MNLKRTLSLLMYASVNEGEVFPGAVRQANGVFDSPVLASE